MNKNIIGIVVLFVIIGGIIVFTNFRDDTTNNDTANNDTASNDTTNDATTNIGNNEPSSDVRDEYLLTTSNGASGLLTYTSKDKESAVLEISGLSYNLKQTVSASGAKYANDDGSVTYWEHQGEATINLADGTTYQVSTIEPADVLTFNIESQKRDCVGVAPMKCLVVNGELFYDNIAGFNFEAGTTYEIIVARIERKNPPADASAYQYKLIKIIQPEILNKIEPV